MDFKEYHTIESWKDVPTDKVIEKRNKIKILLMTTNETYMFIFTFLLFMLPSIVCLLTGGFIVGKLLLLPSFIFHFFTWFFYLKNIFIDDDLRETVHRLDNEIDIVLKDRFKSL